MKKKADAFSDTDDSVAVVISLKKGCDIDRAKDVCLSAQGKPLKYVAKGNLLIVSVKGTADAFCQSLLKQASAGDLIERCDPNETWLEGSLEPT